MKNYHHSKVITLLIFFAATFTFNSLKAQKLVFLFGHAVYSTPAGSAFKDAYNFGAGGEAGVGVGLLGKTFFTGTVGYTDFFHSSANSSGNLSYIPVKAGIRHYLFAKMLFIHGDIGAGFIKENKINYSATKATGDLGVGIKLAGLELLADYDGFLGNNPSGSWFGFKAGFSFGL
ncbi:MAG TPA: hypothetical protein VG738_08590 [Chitinophagaceae bacterium]|nr:hypothetical protein [Chitinophagaceae bacterium]